MDEFAAAAEKIKTLFERVTEKTPTSEEIGVYRQQSRELQKQFPLVYKPFENLHNQQIDEIYFQASEDLQIIDSNLDTYEKEQPSTSNANNPFEKPNVQTENLESNPSNPTPFEAPEQPTKVSRSNSPPIGGPFALSEHFEKTNPMLGALAAVLKQITNGFNDIATGKIPLNIQTPVLTPRSPAHSIHDESLNEPMVGATAPMLELVSLSDHNSPMKKPSKPTNPPSVGENPLAYVQLKLDKVQLPTFSGDLTQWIAFRDQFVELVHNNPQLSSITKFYQLRNHLRGLAYDAINGFEMSAADYETAWLLLRKRYDKPDQIIDEYIRKFEELPFLTHASAVPLIRMVNRVNQMKRVLPRLGVDVQSWDTWIMFTIKSRLDRVTTKKWMDQIKMRQNVPLSELIEFLEVEATECMPTQAEKLRNPKSNWKEKNNPKTNATVMNIMVQGKCVKCGQEHPLYVCPAFRTLTVDERKKVAAEAKLCFRCLRQHDQPADCRNIICKTCHKGHNGMLCYVREKQRKETMEKQKQEKKPAA